MNKNEFWGFCNGRPNKKPENLPAGTRCNACGSTTINAGELICPKCHKPIFPKTVADFNRERKYPLFMPVSKNGCILTGGQPNGKYLTVIAIDVAKGVEFRLDDLDSVSRSTFVVRSGSGGIHIYFYTSSEIGGTQKTQGKHPKATEVDRRGQGGIIFAPGCRFVEHGYNPYIILNDAPIQEVLDDEFWRVWDIYAATRKGQVPDQDHRSRQKTAPQDSQSGVHSQPELACKLAGRLADIETFNVRFPPCINALLTKCKRGIHLLKDERMLLAGFLIKTGHLEDVIVDLFKRVPDFKSEITQYHVDYLKRHAEDKNAYIKGCSTCSSQNMCYHDCILAGQPLRNPLQYVYYYKSSQPTCSKPATPGDDFGKGLTMLKVTGTCISCSIEIPFNTARPLCYPRCYLDWRARGSPDIIEGYCHVCGKKATVPFD